MGGAWPLIFTYQVVSSEDLAPENGVYVLIRHGKFIPGFEMLNFVQSSCDFSLNTADPSHFSFNFGERNNCQPLFMDLFVKGQPNPTLADSAASPSLKGSAFVFKQSKLFKNV